MNHASGWDFTLANYGPVWSFLVQMGLLLLFLMVGNILPDTGLDAKATLLTAFLTLVLVISRKVTKKGIQPISLIAISAVLGILLYGA